MSFIFPCNNDFPTNDVIIITKNKIANNQSKVLFQKWKITCLNFTRYHPVREHPVIF